MKILHVINRLNTGGAEKLIVETLPKYNAAKIKADLLVLNGQEYPFFKELKSQNNCKIFSLGKKSIYNPLHIFQIIPYLRNYDIIHVHLFPSQYFVVLAKLISFCRTKLIFTEHSTSNRRLNRYLFLRLLDVFIYKQYTKIICISPKVKQVLLGYTKLDQGKFAVIENGINIKKIQNSLPLNIKDFFNSYNRGDKILLQVSSFQEPKDQKTLLRAFALLPDYFKLIFVGVGSTEKECRDLAKNLNLSNRIVFLGTRMDVPRLLKSVDIIVLSSNYEGLSLSSIEAMASGKPFLASDVPGLQEIVTGAGILFPAGNEKILAEEILKLISDENYYDTTVSNCLARAEHFDISKMVAKHISLYEELLK